MFSSAGWCTDKLTYIVPVNFEQFLMPSPFLWLLTKVVPITCINKSCLLSCLLKLRMRARFLPDLGARYRSSRNSRSSRSSRSSFRVFPVSLVSFLSGLSERPSWRLSRQNHWQLQLQLQLQLQQLAQQACLHSIDIFAFKSVCRAFLATQGLG